MTLQAKPEGVHISVGLSEILLSWEQWEDLRYSLYITPPKEDVDANL
jgi:hypothetical protein